MKNGSEEKVSSVPRIALNVDDAAASLGISKRLLLQLVKAGRLPCFRPGPQTMIFDPDDLRTLVKSGKAHETVSDSIAA